jgi:hypothetical protein
MIRQVLPSDREGQVQFKFYTYDPTGRDIIIPVWAVDEDQAWVKFDAVYGKDCVVDDVVRG